MTTLLRVLVRGISQAGQCLLVKRLTTLEPHDISLAWLVTGMQSGDEASLSINPVGHGHHNS